MDSRTFAVRSLHTDSEAIAVEKEPAVWNQIVAGWEAKLRGDDDDATVRFDAAKELAELRGFRFMPVSAVAKLPLAEKIERLEPVGLPGEGVDAFEAAAILGGIEAPELTLSGALEAYWLLTRDELAGKPDDQIRRWKNPRIKAINNLIEVIGDKPLRDISADDMLAFRAWWMDRLGEEGLTPNSANKDFIHAGSVLKIVNKMKRLGLVLPLDDLKIKDSEAKKRPEFSED